MISFSGLNERTRPLIIAHRGASADERENTLPAFRRAIAIGVDAIEFDVRRTSDGILVVHHDSSIRPSGPSISRLTYAQNLHLAGSQGFHLPSLKETLELCADKISLDIELKEHGYEREVLSLTRSFYSLDNVVFTSFRAGSLAEIRKIEPRAFTGLLTGFVPQAITAGRFRGVSALSRLRHCGATFLAPNWRLLRFGLLNRVLKLGVPVIAWTVNRSPSASRLARLGVAGIITDYPERIRTAIGNPDKKRRLRR